MTKTGWTVTELHSGPHLGDRYLSTSRLATVEITSSGFAVSATASTQGDPGLPEDLHLSNRPDEPSRGME